MKFNKVLIIIFLMFFFLGGCYQKTNEKLDDDDKIEAGNNDEEDEKEDENISEEQRLFEKEYTVEFDIEVERFDIKGLDLGEANFTGILLINTYEEYLDIKDDLKALKQYDESFFDESSLLIYGKGFYSSAIQYEILSLGLDENNNLFMKVKSIHADEMNTLFAHRIYFINCNKINVDVDVESTIISEKRYNKYVESFSIQNEEGISEINNFLKEHDIMSINFAFYFDDDVDTSNLTYEEIKQYYEDFVDEMIIKYRIDRIKGTLIKTECGPYLDIYDVVDFDYDTLLDIISIDKKVSIVLIVWYATIEYVKG
ncbi:MAG TPA: hypothetical protein GXZ48_03220 [Acholeplasmataceae bacterium]|jgi:hypothetical protein|nr:hypothetical protein [Acholeplasmataceae bacterium]